MAVAIIGRQWHGMENGIGTPSCRESRGMAEATPGTTNSGEIVEWQGRFQTLQTVGKDMEWHRRLQAL